MKLLERRVCGVERARTAPRRTHFFFRDTHETFDAVQAWIRAEIASGQASPSDRLVTFFWRAPEGEERGHREPCSFSEETGSPLSRGRADGDVFLATSP